MNSSQASAAAPLNLAILIKLLRPRQWTKNLIAFAPILFAGRMLDGDALLHASMCVVALCLISGSVYVFNDIIDVEADRKSFGAEDLLVLVGRHGFPRCKACSQ